VVAVNANLKPVFTFETGRSMIGFRHIFPILWEGRHLGSVEFSQPFEHLRRAMHTLDPSCEYLLAVHEQAVQSKLFDEYKDRFVPTQFSKEWLLEDPSQLLPDSPPPLSPAVQAAYAQLGTSQKFLAQLSSNESGSVVIWPGDTPTRVTLLHLNDDWGSSKAVLLSFSRSPELEEIYAGHRLSLTIFTAMSLLGGTICYLFFKSIQTVRYQEEYLRLIADTMDDSLYVLDKDGIITFANAATAKSLGLSVEELNGQVAHLLFHYHGLEEKTALTDCPIHKVVHAGDRYEGEEWFCHANGTPFVAEVASQPMLRGRKEIGSVTVFRDITERKQLDEQLTLLSITDPLTGAFNRRHFLQELEMEFYRAKRYGAPFSLIMLDVDHFKRLNDTYGHEAGDRVLQEMVRLIQGRIRHTDIHSRWGGEEFLLLLTNTPLDAARSLADTLLEALHSHPMEGVGIVTASFGVTSYRHGDSEDGLLSRVDQLMYQAKADGRDRICVSA
jgi:diguanylate cyclase (GGDEF)-like protein/PAS domain S-box-containing protein